MILKEETKKNIEGRLQKRKEKKDWKLIRLKILPFVID